MKRIVFALVATVSTTAAAQAPVDPVDVLAKRVPDELAAEGHVLSRMNLTLQLEQAGDKLVVSLVDLTTGRVAASTVIDQLPPDREAQVASVTQVAGDLVHQVLGRPAQALTVVVDDRAEREAKELAKARFHKESLRFGDTYSISVSHGSGSSTRNWTVMRGDVDHLLDHRDFYRLIDRPDLADDYDHRRNIAIGTAIGGGAGLAVALVWTTVQLQSWYASRPNCQLGDPNFSACVEADANRPGPALTGPLFLGIASLIPLGIGAYYGRNTDPVGEDEAKTMAEGYNNRLRQGLGLPVVEREPVIRDLQLAPYATGTSGGGLALAGRF